MALGGSLLTVIDDITYILDDVASMTKLAAKKTSGVLGDDIALGAQQAQSKVADRELPIVAAIFKGSLINKLILIPIALILSVFIPSIIAIALVLGGLYLCLEGFEKVYEYFFHKQKDVVKDTRTEKEKVKGAIRTDMVLSLEVIVLTLGLVAAAPLMTKVITLFIVGIGMSIFVYSLIALIIRMDDVGIKMVNNSKEESLKSKIGFILLNSAPRVMQTIGIIGTIAMFTVGGGILMHVYHIDLNTVTSFLNISLGIFEEFKWFVEFIMNLVVGVVVGALVFFVFETFLYLKEKLK